VAVTPAPVEVSTLQPLILSLKLVVGWAENFSPCPNAASGVRGAMVCDQIGLTPVWQ